MRDAAGGVILFKPAVVAVCCLKYRRGSGEDCGIEYCSRVVDQSGEGIGRRHAQPGRKAAFQSRLQRVIGRMTDVVPIKRHGREAGIWPQELVPRDRRTAKRRRLGDLTEVRIGYLL